MNVLRRMNRNQQYYMRMICSGRWVIKWRPEFEAYGLGDDRAFLEVPKRKPFFKIKRRTSMRDPWPELVFEWIQRGLLVDVGGRLMPSKDVARVFGMPPPEPPAPKRTLKMSRTRAARNQTETLLVEDADA